jgi:hypothetical protein
VHLYWFGTDPDGIVAKYAFRWVYPPPASQDTPWVRILPDHGWLRTDSMFTVATLGGVGDTMLVMPAFEIYSIDNQGLAGDPAVETFKLRNLPPVVQLTNALGLRDSTYGSVTVSWETIDRDGGGPGLHYRVWLDGNEATYDSTSEQTFTVLSSRFLQGAPPTYQSGLRTLYVQAVDDGGLRGVPATMTWFVRAPATNLEGGLQARLLLIDDLPSTGTRNKAVFDAFYRGVVALLPAGTYDVLHLPVNPNIFRSGGDVAQTFRQFKAVLWYRGDQTAVSPLIQAYQDSIGGWLDHGGNLYLDGFYLVQGLHTPGAFREDFVTRHLGSWGLYHCFGNVGGGVKDSTAGWSNSRGSRFRSSRYGEAFSAITAPGTIPDSSGAVRGFVVRDTSFVALWAMDGQLSPTNTGYEVPVGVTVPQGGGGRLILLTIPVRFAPNPPPSTIYPAASNLLRRMLNEFGIGIPLP